MNNCDRMYLRQCQIPQDQGSVLRGSPPPHTSGVNCQSKMSPLLMTVSGSAVPPAPSQAGFICQRGSQNSGKHLLTRLAVYLKESYLETARWKRCMRQTCRRGQSFQLPPVSPLCPHLPLQRSSFSVYSWPQACPRHKHDGLNHWPLVLKSISSLSPLPGSWEVGMDRSPSDPMFCLAPILRSSPEVTSLAHTQL